MKLVSVPKGIPEAEIMTVNDGIRIVMIALIVVRPYAEPWVNGWNELGKCVNGLKEIPEAEVMIVGVMKMRIVNDGVVTVMTAAKICAKPGKNA